MSPFSPEAVNITESLAKPCWKRTGSMTSRIDIGFKILDAPWEWVEFAMNEIPAFDYEEDLAFLA